MVIKMSYLKKLVVNGIFNFKFLLGVIIVILSMVSGIINSNSDIFDSIFTIDYAQAFLSGYNGSGSFFVIVAPLIATIPFATRHIDNRKSGFIKILISKMGKDKYFNHLFIANLIVTFLEFLIGMLIFFLTCIVLFSKNINFDVYSGITGVSVYKFISNISPLSYIITIILHCSIVSVMYSSLGMAFSYFIKKKFVAWISPFVISIIASLFAMFIGVTKLEPMSIFDVSRVSNMNVFIVIIYVFIVVTFSYIFSKKKFNKDMISDEEM